MARRPGEAGQATVEWTGVVLAVALVLAGLGALAPRLDGVALAETLVQRIACAVGGGGGCRVPARGGSAVATAYGAGIARQVSRFAPNIAYEPRSAALPVDFRRCRRQACANGTSAPVAVARSGAGLPVTAFTRVVDRRGSGGPLYLQYWLYYPESLSGELGRAVGKRRWPGWHLDDWEGYQVRVWPGGQPLARATEHGAYSGSGVHCRAGCTGRWAPWTGWYRVRGGSHAGDVVTSGDGLRTTPGRDLRLVPLETLEAGRGDRFEVSPPWRKRVYRDPEDRTS